MCSLDFCESSFLSCLSHMLSNCRGSIFLSVREISMLVFYACYCDSSHEFFFQETVISLNFRLKNLSVEPRFNLEP